MRRGLSAGSDTGRLGRPHALELSPAPRLRTGYARPALADVGRFAPLSVRLARPNWGTYWLSRRAWSVGYWWGYLELEPASAGGQRRGACVSLGLSVVSLGLRLLGFTLVNPPISPSSDDVGDGPVLKHGPRSAAHVQGERVHQTPEPQRT